MKERHKRKEVYSFILVSHVDHRSRQFVLSASRLRLLAGLLIFFCIGLGIMIYQLSVRGYKEYQLQEQVKQQEKRLQALETENAGLLADGQRLTRENEALQKTIEIQENQPEGGSPDTSLPRLYPSDGVGELQGTFTAEQPYLTIGMQKGNNVVATGDGVIRLVDYDERYLHSVEVEHTNGYISRYFCNKNVEIKVKEGEQVKARTPLFTIMTSDTQLDYQIILDNEAVNPFQVMKLDG